MKVAGPELPGKGIEEPSRRARMSVWAKAVRFIYDDEQILLLKSDNLRRDR
jgi:hypothetical protein